VERGSQNIDRRRRHAASAVSAGVVLAAATACGPVVETGASPAPVAGEHGSRYVFLYLLRGDEDESSDRTRYRLKAFDPAGGGTRAVREVLLPRALHSAAYPLVRYNAGKLFYQLAGPNLEPSGVLLAYDLRSGREEKVFELARAPAGAAPVLASWTVAGDECLFVESTRASEAPGTAAGDRGLLRRFSFGSVEAAGPKTLVDLSAVLPEGSRYRRIESYDPALGRVHLAFEDEGADFLPRADRWAEVFLQPLRAQALSSEEIAARRAELAASAAGSCARAVEASDIFERERVDGVYPPQIRVGCVLAEELEGWARKSR
jgi:hypothetical protein